MTAPVRVLLVSAHAKLGGAEQVLEQLLAGLPPGSVAGVVLLEHGPFEERVRAHDVPCVVLPTSASPLAALRSAQRLSREVARLRPDVVHANGVKAALVAVAARRRAPVVWMKHDVSFDGPVGRLVAGRCAAVVGVSREVLLGLGPQGRRATVVHPGVEVDVDAARRDGARLREELGLAGAVVTVLGRLDPGKGHAELVEVLPEVLPHVRGVTALLVGEENVRLPGSQQRLRELAAARGVAEHVRLPGRLPGAAVLAASDVVVVPTVPDARGRGREGFGLVAAEALALGVPVLGYAVGATPEVVGACGVLVPPGDRVALARELVRVLADDDVRDALARCGPRRAAAFDGARMVEQVWDVHRSVAGAR